MNREIRNTYEVSKTHEISVDIEDLNFLIIYGKHINGWFIAIPNWNVCVETSAPTSDFYNAAQLGDVLNSENVGKHLALAIKEHWQSLQ